MALEGTLDSFGLPEVLALLSMTGKSGRLELQREAVAGHVGLRSGVIVSASSDDARHALARRLVVTGTVGADALAAAVARTDVAVAVAVAEAAGLAASAVAPVATAQVTDAVFELLRWDSGRFAFHPEELAESTVDAALSVDDAVAEGRRRLEAWPALTGRLPLPGVVLALSTALAADVSFSPAEWEILALLDGHRTIGEAVALAAHGEWAAVSLLAGLVERGLLVPVDEASSAAHRAGLLGLLDGKPFAAPASAVAPEVPAFTELSALAADEEVAPFSSEVPGLAPRDTPWSRAADDAAATVTAAPGVGDGSVAAEVETQEAYAGDAVAETTFESVLAEPATAEPAAEDAARADGVDGVDGVDSDLLARLIAGVRAL